MGKMSMANIKSYRNNIGEWLQLFWTNLVVKKRNFMEYLKVVAWYYPNIAFMKIDLAVLSKYLFKSPFAISKEFMIKKGEKDIYVYGETPLTTLDYIADQCDFSSADTVFELGCGRGRGCFWLHCILNCKVVGIEYIPEFVKCANKVKEKFDVKGVEFRLEDILKTDYTGATVLYLYGTCFETPFINKLIERFSHLPSGTKIITVSYSLNDYTDRPLFEVMKRFTARFTWGETDVYLHIKK